MALDTFPHCMWGYIGRPGQKAQISRVPSLYVRVYREQAGQVLAILRSLTVCEGISYEKAREARLKLFPHCMWGYIAWKDAYGIYVEVPSLYVRVYRSCKYTDIFDSSSLTVCEGISITWHWQNNARQFPHCMWGYIEPADLPGRGYFVPSLYVRVYQWEGMETDCCRGSLTVCEGISNYETLTQAELAFPHCMWGYIMCVAVWSRLQWVPSLYVRVYRLDSKQRKGEPRSLTIREGISRILIIHYENNRFPHYTWGIS